MDGRRFKGANEGKFLFSFKFIILPYLFQVYLPAIEGHVPTEVIQTFHAFLEFCYLVRRNIITETTLDEIQDALDRFHRYREFFKTTEVVETFSLPRQH